MSRASWYRIILSVVLLALISIVASCGLSGLRGAEQATATPTRTPRSAVASATPAVTAVASVTLPSVAPLATTLPATATVVPATAIPATATPLPATAIPATATQPPTVAPAPPTATRAPVVQPTSQPTSTPAPSGVDFKITELRVLGLGENNGGIEGIGAGRTIYITVQDAAGNPIDGAKIVNTAPYPGQTVSGDKGLGKAEILMDREEFRLKIESVNGQPVTSEVSHNLSLISPLPQDIVGKLGDTCATLDNCPLPPYKHFSYVITFRKTM